jgi:heat shock protein HslJ
MKRIHSILVLLALVCLADCGGTGQNTAQSTPAPPAEKAPETPGAAPPAAAESAPVPPAAAPAAPLSAPQDSGLAGTSWRLVKIQGMDDKAVVPDDGAKYTLSFAADGAVAARIDCNRGRGSWKSEAPGQLNFGPLMLTRAMCPPESLHDRFVRDWQSVRGYVLKDGHLYLSLMADGGDYEFEPMGTAN